MVNRRNRFRFGRFSEMEVLLILVECRVFKGVFKARLRARRRENALRRL